VCYCVNRSRNCKNGFWIRKQSRFSKNIGEQICAACGGIKLRAEPNALQKVSSFFIIVNTIDDKIGRAIKFFSFQGIQRAFVAESPNSFSLIFSKWINPKARAV